MTKKECKTKTDLNKPYCHLNLINSDKVMIHLVKVSNMICNLNNSDTTTMITRMLDTLFRKIYNRMILKMKNVWGHAVRNLDIFLKENNASNA
jgi:hypothetical protein